FFSAVGDLRVRFARCGLDIVEITLAVRRFKLTVDEVVYLGQLGHWRKFDFRIPNIETIFKIQKIKKSKVQSHDQGEFKVWLFGFVSSFDIRFSCLYSGIYESASTCWVS